MHYKRCWRHGTLTPQRNRRPHDVPIEDWFWTLVDKTPTCWLWTGNILHRRGGYGTIYDPRRKMKIRAHHFLVGKPGDGMEWDHLCCTPRCVRPSHLELVTVRENRLRQWARMRAKHRRQPPGMG